MVHHLRVCAQASDCFDSSATVRLKLSDDGPAPEDRGRGRFQDGSLMHGSLMMCHAPDTPIVLSWTGNYQRKGGCRESRSCLPGGKHVLHF